MKPNKEICVLCAWRENCSKKFSISGRDIRCPDFVRDLSIKEEVASGGVWDRKLDIQPSKWGSRRSCSREFSSG